MTRMYNPAHPDEIIREALEAERWTVTGAPIRLGVRRNTLSCVVNGKAGASPRSGWVGRDERSAGPAEG